MDLPKLTVSASWRGALSELQETYITSPIEGAIQGVRDVRKTSLDLRWRLDQHHH